MMDRRTFLGVAGSSLATLVVSGCSAGGEGEPAPEAVDPVDPVDVRVAALKGPTAMGLVRFMSEAEAGNCAENNYSFQILASPDEVTPLIAKGEVDVAAVPANLASVLYNKTEGAVRAICINTLGVLYLCSMGDDVRTMADLKGHTIYAAGKGATPEYVLTYLLEKSGLAVGTDVAVEWKSEHAECVEMLRQNAAEAVALLPQPFVTTAMVKDDRIRVALDLNKEWEAIQDAEGAPSRLVTGVAVVRSAFADEHPEAVHALLGHYGESVAWVNDHVEDAAELVGGYGIVPQEVAVKAIPECNITFVDGASMKEQLSGYLAVLEDQNPAAVGGKLPEDDFYFGA